MAGKKLFLKTSDVAEIFGVNPSTVFLWVKKKRLRPHKTLGGNFRFLKSDVEKLISEKRNKSNLFGGSERRLENRFGFNTQISVKIGKTSNVFNGQIKDISTCGMNLILEDDRNGFNCFTEESVSEITIIRLPSKLFKETVLARVRHFERISDNRISLGVSLF
jgi:excisionase family DNA binding protein